MADRFFISIQIALLLNNFDFHCFAAFACDFNIQPNGAPNI